MKEEIRQFGVVLLWAEGDEYTSIPMIFRNMAGRNFSGKPYSNYVRHVLLVNGFEVGDIELWRDGELVDRGSLTLSDDE